MAASDFSLPSFAKINLFLKVLGRRDDGFHEICTAFQTISIRDTISFREAGDITLSCDDSSMDCGPENLIIRAAVRLRERFGVVKGAEIRLEKKIPYPGGLGGGSSNAAVSLAGLSHLWGLDPETETLHEIASSLGSDVPFFLYGGTAIGSGRGEIVKPLPDGPGKYLLLAVPNVRIPTAGAYEMLGKPGLTKENRDFILNVCRELGEKLDSGLPEPVNDFESAVFDLAPEVRQVKDELLSAGASTAMMSGSGASLFGSFENRIRRDEAFAALRKAMPGLKLFAAESVPRADYVDALGEAGRMLAKVPD